MAYLPILAALYLATFVLRFGFGSLTLILPWHLEGWGVPVATIGLVAAANPIAEMLSALPSGVLSDRYGRRPLILLGLLGCGVIFLGYPLAGGVLHMALLSFSLGVFEAMTISPALASITDYTAKNIRGGAMGLFNSSVTAGYITGPVVASLLSSRFGPQSPFYFASALMFLALGLTFLLVRDGPITQSATLRESIGELHGFAKSRAAGGLIIVWTIAMMILSISTTFLPVVLRMGGLSQETAAVALAGGAAFLIASYTVFGRISDRVGRRSLMLFGLMVAGGAAVALRIGGISQLKYTLPLIGLGAGAFSPAAVALFGDMAPLKGRGATMGLYDITISMGLAVGPLVGGYVADRFGFSWLFSACASLMLVAGLIVAVAVKDERGPP